MVDEGIDATPGLKTTCRSQDSAGTVHTVRSERHCRASLKEMRFVWLSVYGNALSRVRDACIQPLDVRQVFSRSVGELNAFL